MTSQVPTEGTRPLPHLRRMLPPQDPQDLLELEPHLTDDLLALREIAAGFLPLQLVARSADGEALVVQETPDRGG